MAVAPKPQRFATAAAFRAWLARHHGSADEIVVRCYKTHASKQGMTYGEALDEVLCHGWIDGVRRAIDDVSFSVRFTPRSPRSIWSRVNIRKVEALIAQGRMAKPGLDAFRAREESRTGLYSFERASMELTPAFLKRFKARKGAWEHFQTQPPWYRRTSTFWVMSAKQEATRERRLETLIDCSGKNLTLPQLTRTPSAKKAAGAGSSEASSRSRARTGRRPRPSPR